MLLGEPRHRWKDNITVGLTLVGCILDSAVGYRDGPTEHGNETSANYLTGRAIANL
jgi:hypothetical protein